MFSKKTACFIFFLLFSHPFPTTATKTSFCNPIKSKPKLAFIVPTFTKGSFFDRLVQISKIASEQLDIDLTIHLYNEALHNRFLYAQFIDDILTENNDYDYLVGLFYKQTERNVINVIKKHQVHYFSFNSPLTQHVKNSIGMPRENTPYWIGHLSPDEKKLGYDIATQLINSVNKEKVSLLAINGSRNSEVSTKRAEGLIQKLSETPHVDLLQIVYTNWSYEEARMKSNLILDRHKAIDMVWAASDTIARAFVEEINKQDPERLSTIAINSIDWSPQIIPYIKNNSVSNTFGGHIFEGAWLMALIYDHFNGLDFVDELGSTIMYPMTAITSEHIDALAFTNTHFKFKQLSKCHSPSTKKYQFEPLTLLKTN